MDAALRFFDMADRQRFLNHLLSKNHLLYALEPSDSDSKAPNTIPIVLAALFQLGASDEVLQRVSSRLETDLELWPPSQHRILDRDTLNTRLGLPPCQRDYMDYFSTEHTCRGLGATPEWAMAQLLKTDDILGKGLLHGLFGQMGRPLLFLGEGLNLPNALLVVQGLTLAAMAWSLTLQQIVLSCALPPDLPIMVPSYLLGSVQTTYILDRVRTDGRFSGLVLTATPDAEAVLGHKGMREALIMYARQLDLSDMDATLNHLSRLAVLMACASHKPRMPPAFDVEFARLPGLVFSLRMLLQAHDKVASAGDGAKPVFVRGVWMLMLLSFVLNGRPVITEGLTSGPASTRTWEDIFEHRRLGFSRSKPSKYEDADFSRLIISIIRLNSLDNDRDNFYRTMAWYVVKNWKRWGANPWGSHLNITTV